MGSDLAKWDMKRIVVQSRKQRQFGELSGAVAEVRTQSGVGRSVTTERLAKAIKDAVREGPKTETDLISALRTKGLLVSSTGFAAAVTKLTADGELRTKKSSIRRGKGSGKRYMLVPEVTQ